MLKSTETLSFLPTLDLLRGLIIIGVDKVRGGGGFILLTSSQAF